MNCPYYEQVTDAYLSGEIESPEWRGHVNECPSCAALLRSESDFDLIIKYAVNEERLQTRQLEAHIHDAICRSATPWHRPVFVMMRYGIAAAVVFATLLIATLGYAKGRMDRNAVCIDAADDHQEEIIGKAPRKWRSDPAEVAALSLKLVGDPSVPARVAPAGYHLVGARVCILHGKRYMHLAYSDGDNQVSLFVRRQENHTTLTSRLVDLLEPNAPATERVESLTVGSAQKHNLSLVLVSPSSLPDVQRIVETAANRL